MGRFRMAAQQHGELDTADSGSAGLYPTVTM